MATVGLNIIEERAKLLSYCQSRFQPICQGILSLDLSEKEGFKSNELTQLSNDSPIANTLYKLLDSETVPVEEFFVKIANLPKKKKNNHKALTGHESIILKDFSIKLLCELEKLAVVLTIAAAKLQTLPDEARGILLCLVPFIKNKTDTELEMVCREVNISSWTEISQIQYDSPDTQLSQGTKPSEETHVNSTVSPVIENSESKTFNDICDKPVITTNTINQDGNVANEARPQLYSNMTTGQYHDFSSKSTHTHSSSNNAKRKKRILPKPRNLSSPN